MNLKNFYYNRTKQVYLAWLLSGIFIINGPMIFSMKSFAANQYRPNLTNDKVKITTQNELITTNTTATDLIEFSTNMTMRSMQDITSAAESIATTTYKSTVLNHNEKSELTTLYMVTDEERELLARLVELEAGNQTLEERAKVVKVVLNRVEAGGIYGDEIEEVIFKPNQFTPAPNIPYTTPSKKSYNAVDAVISGEIDLSDFECLYFWGDGKLNHFYTDFITKE